MIPINISNIVLKATTSQTLKSHNLWVYVAIAFNKVEIERLKLVGPDRLCAEWLLKNSGAVSLVQAPGKFLKDYNNLPPESTRIQIKEIDASNSSIMKIGLDHLKSCKHIDRVILHSCKHLESDGLQGLSHIKDTLKHLQVSSCYNIDDEGLLLIKELTELNTLRIFDMQAVNDLNRVVAELKQHLTKCTIDASD